MVKCRKNYSNLLLLSVLCFALSVPVCPVKNEFGRAVNYQAATGGRYFQWDNQSAVLVYRGQQLNVTVGDEFAYLPPEMQEMPLIPVMARSVELVHCRAVLSADVLVSASRAPPEKC